MLINAETLKNTRKEKGLGQRDFADFLGVGYRTYQGYESGTPIPEARQQLIAYKLNAKTADKTNEPVEDYRLNLAEYNKELSHYKAKNVEELRDIAYKFLANEEALYKHNLLPDNREMHFWIRYKEIVEEYGSIEDYLNKEI